MRLTAAFAALLALSVPARAADFEIIDGLDGRPAAIMWGDIRPGDNVKFSVFVRSHPQFFSILLQGDGGAIDPAVRIGNFAHILGLQTVALGGRECASACALIWAGGTKRTMEPEAKVGFHGVFTIEGGAPQPSSAGNALVGAYLGRMGYSDAAVAYMTAAAPTDMAWLDPAKAHAVGLDYDVEVRPVRKRSYLSAVE